MNSTENNSLQFKAPENKWRKWALAFGIWTILSLSFTIRQILSFYRTGADFSWREILSANLIDFYMWGLASPLVFRLAKRFPIERENLTRRIFLHLGLSAIFAFVMLDASLPVLWYLTSPARYSSLWDTIVTEFVNPYYFHQGLLIYWSLLILAHALEFYRQLRIKKIQAAELSAQLAHAQLSALKMQLHPHFLFNTLNSIAALLHKDVELADKMIARLSDFLRMTLNSPDTPVATLGQELEFLQTYLEIEKIRFQERLIIKITAAPAALEARVPNLILQPLVENAVRHGVAKQKAIGHLEVSAELAGDRLLIKVKDNGPGLKNSNGFKKSSQEGGLGLVNTRARLEQFYNHDFEFEITANPGENGTIVKLNVPFLI